MSKRTRPEKGYYTYLHNISSVDLDSVEPSRTIHEPILNLASGSDELPEGVFQVERIMHERITKVSKLLYNDYLHN